MLDIVPDFFGILVFVVVAGNPEAEASGRVQDILLDEVFVAHPRDFFDDHRESQVTEVRVFLCRSRGEPQGPFELEFHQLLLCRYRGPSVLHHYPSCREHRVSSSPGEATPVAQKVFNGNGLV